MSVTNRIMGSLYHPSYVYTNNMVPESVQNHEYVFVYSKDYNSIKSNISGHLNLFKAGCMSHIDKDSAEGNYDRSYKCTTLFHVLLHNIFKKNKIIIINGCMDFPVFSYSTKSYMVDNSDQMKNFPYKFKGQLFFCSDTSKYFYYTDNEFRLI